MTDKALFALVPDVHEGWLSKHCDPKVDVLAGSIAKGDEIEVVRPDGTVVRRRVERGPALGPADGAAFLRLEGVLKGEMEPGDLIRAPDGRSPALELADEQIDDGNQLLEAVRSARRTGPANSPEYEFHLCADRVVKSFRELLARPELSDEVIALFVQKQARRALRPDQKIHGMTQDLAEASIYFDALGLQTEGDRLRLAAAAALEGHRVGVVGRAAATGVAVGALAETAGKQASGVALLGLGIESSEGFAYGYQKELAGQGKAIRQRLQKAGRAVAVGWCKKCRAVARLDEDLRCEAHGKHGLDPVAVVPADLPAAEAIVRGAHR